VCVAHDDGILPVDDVRYGHLAHKTAIETSESPVNNDLYVNVKVEVSSGR